MKKVLTCLGFLFIASVGCMAQETSEDFDQLVAWLSGEYTATTPIEMSGSQDKVVLHIVRIWPKAANGAWMYVEEAKADSLDSPFNQQVYFLSEISDGEYSLDVYKIPEASELIGAWESPAKFDGMTAFDLKNRNGCALFLNYDGFQYSGKSNSGTCKSQNNDSEYSTSDIILLANEYKVWNRNFDAEGKQVSGAKKEPIKYAKK